MILLALDQASQTSGWAVFNSTTEQLIAYGNFTFQHKDFDTRMYHIYNKVKELIDLYDIEEVYLEDIQLQEGLRNNVVTYKRLAELLGVLSYLCVKLGLPHSIVSSSTWRSVVGIKGKKREDKKQNAKRHVEEQYGLKVSEDTADAICIGEYALISNNNPNDWSD